MEKSCNAKTLEGKRCKRKRKLHIARWLCWQHWTMFKKDHTSVHQIFAGN